MSTPTERRLAMLFGFCMLAAAVLFSLSLIGHAVRLVAGFWL